MSAVVSPSELAPAHHCFQLPQVPSLQQQGPWGEGASHPGCPGALGFEAQWDHLILVSSSH